MDGVAEVASIGGFVKQYQVTVDPARLRAYHLSLSDVRMAVERSNGEVGGRSIELAEKEFILRVRGYVQNLDELRAVADAQAAGAIRLPAGYNVFWSGQYEHMLRAQQRLTLVIPLTLLLIVLILYLNTRSVTKTAIVLLAVPFSLVGAFWAIHLCGYNLSVAVWVGVIALAGLDAETGVVMLLYLDLAHAEWVRKGLLRTPGDLRDAIYHGAVQRVRPKAMTACVIVAGLLPILWSHGAGADVMKRIATPMVGGVVTSTLMELLVYPRHLLPLEVPAVPGGPGRPTRGRLRRVGSRRAMSARNHSGGLAHPPAQTL